MANNSPFNEKINNDNLRFIKWEGGSHPKILNMTDKLDLIGTNSMFARKFDCNQYPETLNMINQIISINQKYFNENR